MLLASSISLQSSDDESITIELTTECLDIDLTQYDAYWELKKTLSSEAVLIKTTAGTEWLPPGFTQDVILDSVSNTITIFMNANETAPLMGQYFQYLYLRNKFTLKKTSITYGTITFLENADSEYPEIYYTTPEYVAEQLEMSNEDGTFMIFTEDTNPKRSTVINFIQQAEMRIDRETRNSWRENYVGSEMHDIHTPLGGVARRDIAIPLDKSHIMMWDETKGDSLQVSWGNTTWDTYHDPLTKQGSTWWIDYTLGILHLNNIWPWYNSGQNRIVISYRWGATEAPPDVTEACTKLVAIRLLQTQFNRIMLYNRQSNPINWNDTIKDWQKTIESICATRRRKVFTALQR